MNNPKILFINSLDKRYGSTCRARLIRDSLKKLGCIVKYAESNCPDHNGETNIPQRDCFSGYFTATLKRAWLCLFDDYQILFLQKFLPLNFACVFAAKLRGKKIAVDWDDLDSALQSTAFRRMLTGLIERHVPGYADAVFTHNRHLKAHAEKLGIKKLYFLPQAVDSGLFTPDIYDRDKIRDKMGLTGKTVLLFLGTLTEGGAKGLDTIIKAVRRLEETRKNICLLIAGGGPLKEKYEKILAESGIKNSRITGVIEHENVPEYIAASDIGLIFMDDDIGNRMRMSLKLIEYLCMEKKVVGRLSGESFDKMGEFCCLCGDTEDSLAGKIAEAIDSGSLKRGMRDFIIKNHDASLLDGCLKNMIYG